MAHDKRFFTLRGRYRPPISTESKQDVSLELYEQLEDNYIDVVIHIDNTPDRSSEQLFFTGTADLGSQHYRATANFFSKYPWNDQVTMVLAAPST